MLSDNPNQSAVPAASSQQPAAAVKYPDKLKSAKTREIKLRPEQDVFSLKQFIELYAKTYKAEISWVEAYTKADDELKAQQALPEQAIAVPAVEQINQERLDALYARLRLKHEQEQARCVSVTAIEPEILETLKHSFDKKLDTLKNEYERLLKLVDGGLLNYDALNKEWSDEDIAYQQKLVQSAELAAKRAALDSLETQLNDNNRNVDKNRRILKSYTYAVLQGYAATLKNKGECLVSVVGRSHGEGLPFEYPNNNHISRIQFVHLSAENYSCFIDVGSIGGTVCKFKYRQQLTQVERDAAVGQAKYGAAIARQVSTYAGIRSGALATRCAETTVARTNHNLKLMQQGWRDASSQEMDFSTKNDIGLGIIPLSQNGICCVKMGGEPSTYLQLELHEGKINSVLALYKDEYLSTSVFTAGLQQSVAVVTGAVHEGSTQTFFGTVAARVVRDSRDVTLDMAVKPQG